MKVIRLLFATVILLSYTACTAPIELETRNSKPIPVIYGCLTDELKHQSVRLTSSAPYFDTKKNSAIPEARVTIASSDGKEYAFVSEADGYYLSNVKFAVNAGVTYRLRVEIDFDGDGANEIYEAETTPPPIAPADSIAITADNIMGFKCFTLRIYMQEPPDDENYYLFRYIINDSIANDRLTEMITTRDRMFNGAYLNGLMLTMFEDATADNTHFGGENRNRDQVLLSPGDSLRLQILNIEQGYFHFISECRSEKNGENPLFGGPPSNIATNISNGAVGYFTSYLLQELNTETPTPP